MMLGKRWKNITRKQAEIIKDYIIKNGGELKPPGSTAECWAIKFHGATLIYYRTGTLYSTHPPTNQPTVFTVWEKINQLVGSEYSLPTKKYLIGLDETGKGELLGSIILVGVAFPADLFESINEIIGPADTKKTHHFDYWEKILSGLLNLKRKGLEFTYKKISPDDADQYRLNRIMDLNYQEILEVLLKTLPPEDCRVVIDDYRLGPDFKKHLQTLKEKKAEVLIQINSEDRYLETKTASLIAKGLRSQELKEINECPQFQINGLKVGSGNANDPQTIRWLKEWWSQNKNWPWFVKKSYRTILRIEGKKTPVNKILPDNQ